jgi:hypothetical protein
MKVTFTVRYEDGIDITPKRRDVSEIQSPKIQKETVLFMVTAVTA